MTTRDTPPPSASQKNDAILARLHTLHPKVIDLSLERVERLLDALGAPHTKLPPVIHVAGTNGKGSVIAYLRAMLNAAGYRCHVYTSPHLVDFSERIVVADEQIAQSDLAALLEECESANNGAPITFFEITTAAAFLAFARTPADVVLLETGLGGRLDATNVIAAPAVTAITPVSMDHQQYLGDSLDGIMKEKAGILKPGAPCIAARPQGPKTARALESAAKTVGAKLLVEGRDWYVRAGARGADEIILTLNRADGETSQTYVQPALYGVHQMHNAAQAIACLAALPGFDVPDAAINLGLRSARWPARMQRLQRGPLVERLPSADWELWLDGGHNEAAANMLRQQSRRWRDKPLHLIMGMLSSKDPIKFLKPLEGKCASFGALTIPDEPAAIDATDLCENAQRLRMNASAFENVGAAVDGVVQQFASQPAGRILICGSLYLAGHVLRDNG